MADSKISGVVKDIQEKRILAKLENDSSISDELKEKCKRHDLTFSDLHKNPSLRKYAIENFFAHYSTFDQSSNLINYLGFNNAIKLYDEYPLFTMNVITKNMSWFIKEENISKETYEQAKERLFNNIVKHASSYHYANFNTDIIPKEMWDLHPEIVFEPGELPDEVINHYYDGTLKLSELRQYKDILKKKNIDFGLRMRRSFCAGISYYFGLDIWGYIDNFSKEYDIIFEEFDYHLVPNTFHFPDEKGEVKELTPEYIDSVVKDVALSFVKLNSSYHIGEKYNIDQLYFLSKYVPIEKIINSKELLNFIKKCGFDNIIKFNRSHDNILKIKNGEIVITDKNQSFKLLRLINTDNLSVSSPEDFKEVFHKAVHRYRCLSYTLTKDEKEILSKVFPNQFIDKELCDSLIENIKDEEFCFTNYIRIRDISFKLENTFMASRFNTLDFMAFINQYPQIIPAFLDKDIILNTEHSFDDYSKFYEKLGNNLFLEVCSKYGRVLACGDHELYEKLMEIDFSNDYEQEMNKAINLFIKRIPNTGFSFLALPESFKTTYSHYYLDDESIPNDIRERYYKHTLMLSDFTQNPRLINYFSNFNIMLGFPARYSWIGRVLNNNFYPKNESQNIIANKNALIILDAFMKSNVSKSFKECMEYGILDYLYDDFGIIKKDAIYFIATFIPRLDMVDSYISTAHKILQYVSTYANTNNKLPFNKMIYLMIKNKDILNSDLIFLPDDFREKYPSLYEGLENLPDEIKEKYRNRNLTPDDFKKYPNLFKYFDETNIINAFPENYSWIGSLYTSQNISFVNKNIFIIADKYSKIKSTDLGVACKALLPKYIKNHNDELLTEEKLDMLLDILTRITYSNAIEITAFKLSLTDLLFATDNPVENLKKIEDIFLRNNIPLCGKMFLCFKILYPKVSNVDGGRISFDDKSRLAPGFLNSTVPNVGFHASNEEKRQIVIFNDLLRVSYRSGERSLIEYLNNIEIGNNIYSRILQNNFDITGLSESDKEILEIFVSHLEVLYSNTKKGKDSLINFDGLDLPNKLRILGKEFGISERHDLKDRIVRSFCYMAGIKSFDELKELVIKSSEEQKTRINKFMEEIKQNGGVFKFQEGDYVRGIGDIEALIGSIGTGNYSKEHLGVFRGYSESDTTPLDVDITQVKEAENIYAAIAGSPTGFGFGNIYVILKKDNPNLYISRDKGGNFTHAQYDPTKIEMFQTGYETHWGARTGISFADIDCILYKQNRIINDKEPYDENGNVNYTGTDSGDSYDKDDLPAVKFAIVRNGYYIPVIDFAGRIIFTEEEFNFLRSKMQGLSYYGETTYELSDELIIPDVEKIASTLDEDSVKFTVDRRNKVYAIIKEVMDELGISMKYSISRDLSRGSIEIIDTGSTGRNTNIPYDGDFDLYMRLDAEIMRRSDVLSKFKKLLENKFREYGAGYIGYTDHGDLRLDKFCLNPDKPEEMIKIDISFGVKTSKVVYSSDVCLSDRLETIKKLYPDQYKYVVANIILAKQILKSPEVGAYKPHRTDPYQGGLGGIGVENWILQNGGSFVQACRSFLKAATDEKTGEIISFDEFRKKYEIWDFGENHFTARGDRSETDSNKRNPMSNFLYDNFVTNNMNSTGYQKMIKMIKEYLNKIDLGLSEDDKAL